MSLKNFLKSKRPGPSEAILGLPEQPEPSCPFIDKTIADTNSFLAKLSSIQEKLGEFPKNSEDLLDTEDTIEEVYNKYKTLGIKLEIYRSALDDLRKTGNTQKSELWSFLNQSFLIDEERKAYSINEKDYEQKKIEIQSLSTHIEDIKSILLDLKELESLYFNSEPLDIALVKELNIFREKELDEILNGIYLEEWAKSVHEISKDTALETIESVLISFGFKRN